MINVFGASVGNEELAQIRESVEKSWLGMGKKVEEFESRFAVWRGLDNFLMVDSGSNALYMAVSILELPKGSEVILPSFTWVSCAQAVILAGCKPVFCDVDYDTCNVTAETIKPLISDNTSAIMVVHYAGRSVDLDPILELGYPVIEDAAHAVASTYRDSACGGIGDVGIYSFDAVKNLTAGEGGGMTFRNPAHYEKAKSLRYCGIGKSGFQQSQQQNRAGIWWEYDIKDVFIKMLPTDLAAGIALAQLEKIEKLQARRKEIWDIYNDELRSISELELPVSAELQEEHSYFTYVVKARKRNDLAIHLLEHGIYSTLRYHPLHLNEIYQQSAARLPVTEQLNDVALSIPLHPALSDDDVSQVIQHIRQFYRL